MSDFRLTPTHPKGTPPFTRRWHEIEDAWWSENAERVRAWLARFGDDDEPYARAHLHDMVQRQAHLLAQGRTGSWVDIKIGKEDFERVDGRVRSQRPISARPAPPPITPRYVRQSAMAEDERTAVDELE